jgi:hypothetical protein
MYIWWQMGTYISRMRWEAATSENGCQFCGPIVSHEYLASLLNALFRATCPAYFPYVTYPVHFTAGTIARSVPTADLLLSQIKLGFYGELDRCLLLAQVAFPNRRSLTSLGLSHQPPPLVLRVQLREKTGSPETEDQSRPEPRRHQRSASHG